MQQFDDVTTLSLECSQSSVSSALAKSALCQTMSMVESNPINRLCPNQKTLDTLSVTTSEQNDCFRDAPYTLST